MDVVSSGWRVRETFLSRKPSPSARFLTLGTLAILGAAAGLCLAQEASFCTHGLAQRRAIFFLGEHWRLFTTLLIHANLEHLLSNALPLAVLSYLVYGYYGFWVFPVTGVILAAGVNLWALYTYPAGTVLIGASGLVYLLSAFWLTMYVFLERRRSLGQRLLRSLGFALIVLFPTTFKENISYRTHAFGFLVGCLWAVAYFYGRRSEFRAAEKLEWEDVED